MPWNPEIYNQFKNVRYQPFFDLMALITEHGLKNAIDIGCGTGEQTAILAEKFEYASFTGIDSSAEMLQGSGEWNQKNLNFRITTVEDFVASDQQRKWDLIFSNAALQWSDDHESLFPGLIALLNQAGQFAVQMPVQNENMLNKILLTLAQEQPFAGFLKNWKRETPMLSIDQYAKIMFQSGLEDIQIVQKVYPIIADDEKTLFDFISGSALIPYLERLSPDQQKLFVREYSARIKAEFGKFPAMYAFKRLLLYGRKS
jgi:trans-aconitate 2-methyltransferase